MYDDAVIEPWFRHLVGSLPGVRLVDVHAHTGQNDPDNYRYSAAELVGELERIDARGVAIPMHEPGGYPPANDRVLAEAEASGGRLVAFCRVDPRQDAVAEARRCLDAGARGIKLHPRAEGFTLSHPAVDEIVALAAERRVPVLIHAGRGIPALGVDAVALALRHPDARLLLGHAGICDLSWVWRQAADLPNLLFDLSWWQPADFAALFAFVSPGQIVFASDLPYFTPMLCATLGARFGLQAGLTPEQLAGVLGEQGRRLLDGEELLDLGPAPGPGALGYSVLLERVTTWLGVAVGRMILGDSGFEAISLARLACDVGDDRAPEADVCRNVLALLDAQEAYARERASDGEPCYPGVRSIMLAACIARTPDVTLPRVSDLEDSDKMRERSGAGHRAIDEAALPPRVDDRRDLRGSSAADHYVLDASEQRGTSGEHSIPPRTA